MHDEERGAEEKVPLGQSVQLSEPAVGEYEPGAHASHDVAEFVTKVPAGQRAQLSASKHNLALGKVGSSADGEDWFKTKPGCRGSV